MIVSNTVTTALSVPLGLGAVMPQVGMVPAKAEPDRAHVKAIVIKNRFIDFSPFLRVKRRCKIFYISENRTTSRGFLQGLKCETNIPSRSAGFLTLTTKGISLMKIASPKINTTHLTANEEALRRCQIALELRDKGDFDGTQEVMRRIWRGVGSRPETSGLHPSVAAEVLLCVGILTGWIGSRNEIKEADGYARDLITESITIFESLGDLKKIAEARTELAYCYWREGSFDEARIMFTEALKKLTTEGKTRANALLGLAVVEWSCSRNPEALRILTDNASLFKKITHHTLKGFYHNTLAQVLQTLVTPEKKTEELKRIVKAYEQADHQFKLARNTIFRALVKNNLGIVLRDLGRYREAQEYLDHARRLIVTVRDKVRTAQIDQARAEVMIAQRRYEEAERATRFAAKSFEKAGRQCLLAEALTVRGIALARLSRTEEAQYVFQRAIEIARQVEALNVAGIAALTLIEELDNLSIQTSAVAYERANEWLAKSQSPDLLRRMQAAAVKVLAKVQEELMREDVADDAALSNKRVDFNQVLLNTEHALIKRALAQVNGSVTRAASNLSMSYQKLAYILETRHKDLLTERTPIRRRAGPGSRK
jgi:tetratricopeptide (TPR) repeat protein